MDVHTLIAVNLRLLQSRVLEGPRTSNGTRQRRFVGLRYLDCASCEEQDPGLDSALKRQRGCRKYGLRYEHSEGEGHWKVDHTGQDARDHCTFCPAVLADARLQRWILEAIEIEYPGGGLDRVSQRTYYHLPERVFEFYAAVIAARNRWDAEVGEVERELSRTAGS